MQHEIAVSEYEAHYETNIALRELFSATYYEANRFIEALALTHEIEHPNYSDSIVVAVHETDPLDEDAKIQIVRAYKVQTLEELNSVLAALHSEFFTNIDITA